MMDIEITNYRSIGHIKIVIDGFTTLVGRNYIGKSNVLRAINSALTNEQNNDYIKWGESFCEVRIKAQGLDILWHREASNNYYKINDKKYEKIGKEDPPKEILDAGYKLLHIGNGKINLNYAQQFVPLFLLDKQDSKSIDLLTSVYGLDRLYDAINLCNKEQNDINDLLRLREKDLELVEADLDRYTDFEATKKRIETLKEFKISIDNESRALDQLKGFIDKVSSLSIECKRLKRASFVKLPSESELKSAINEYTTLKKQHQDVVALSSKLRSIKPSLDINLPKDKVDIIQRGIKDLKKVAEYYSRISSLSHSIDKLSHITEVQVPTIRFSPEDLTKLKQYSIAMEGFRSEILSLKDQAEKCEASLKATKKERDAYSSCPLCGHSLS